MSCITSYHFIYNPLPCIIPPVVCMHLWHVASKGKKNFKDNAHSEVRGLNFSV